MIRFLFIGTLLLSAFFSAAGFSLEPNGQDSRVFPLRWRRTVIPLQISTSLLKTPNSIRPGSDVEGAVARSLETWTKAGGFEFAVTWTDQMAVSSGSGDGVSLLTIAATSENLVFLGSDAVETAAKTRVFFSRRQEITEADIVLNPFQQFSTDGSFGTFDLESTLVHEIGHLLGLDHSPVFAATMAEKQARNGLFLQPATSWRNLAADDLAKLRAKYGRGGDDCCREITGRLVTRDGRSGMAGLFVWAEDALDGRLLTLVETGSDGSFRLGGITSRRPLRLLAAHPGGLGAEIARVDAGSVSRLMIPARRFPSADETPVSVEAFGLGSQLGTVAVTLVSGQKGAFFVGGRNLDRVDGAVLLPEGQFRLGELRRSPEFGGKLNVISAAVEVAPTTPVGEYSLQLTDGDGRTLFIPGAVRVVADDSVPVTRRD